MQTYFQLLLPAKFDKGGSLQSEDLFGFSTIIIDNYSSVFYCLLVYPFEQIKAIEFPSTQTVVSFLEVYSLSTVAVTRLKTRVGK